MKRIATAMMVIILLASTAPSAVFAEQFEEENIAKYGRIAQDHAPASTTLRASNQLKSKYNLPEKFLQLDDKETNYTVEWGDTLTAIARDYEVTIDELMLWNELPSDLILVDQELVIHPEIVPDPVELVEAELETEDQEVEQDETEQEIEQEEVMQVTAEQEQAYFASGEARTMTATAYTAECEGCTGVTYTGIDLNADRTKKVIAVDPDVIPLGALVYVEGYGEAIAGDIGGAIKGNKIDIHVPTRDEALAWGVREVSVTIIERE